jgi:hypothetical protein
VNKDGKNMQVSFALPKTLTGILAADLRAYATLDGGRRYELTVIDNTLSGEISNVAIGERVLVLTYYVMQSEYETVLATISKSVTVTKGTSTNVTISSDEWNRNIDDDGDGYTNLAEVRLNTNPKDASDFPDSQFLFAIGYGSIGYADSSSYTSSSIVGQPIIGDRSSVNYNVVDGFANY